MVPRERDPIHPTLKKAKVIASSPPGNSKWAFGGRSLHHPSDLFGMAGMYGNGLLIESLNFDDHVWITEETDRDPYKTLSPVFSPDTVSVDPRLFRLSQEAEDDEDEEGTAITACGVAMSAYNYTQYADLAPADRHLIRAVLLRYCELDTLAMVMLVLGLFELRDRPLRVV